MSSFTSITPPQVSLVNGRPSVTSLKIAEHFGKRHDSVLRDIHRILLEMPEDLRLHNFVESSYANKQGKEQPMYDVARDGFMLLVMGYTGKRAMQIKLAFIAAFNAMEAELAAGRDALPPAAVAALEEHATPSTVEDRRPLSNLVIVWCSLSGQMRTQAWMQVNAHFGLKSVTEMPVEWIPDALAFVQGQIDEIQRQKALPGVQEQKALPEVPALPSAEAERLAAELDTLFKEMYDKNSEFERWLNDFDSRLAQVIGPVFYATLNKLAPNLIVKDRGIDMMRSSWNMSLKSIQAGLRQMVNFVFRADWLLHILHKGTN